MTQALIRHRDIVQASSAKQEEKKADIKKEYRRKDTPKPNVIADNARAALK